MKHISKGIEPQELSRYKKENPGKKWEDFRQECPQGVEDVYQTLYQSQGGLCAYCEIKLNEQNRQIEHFHDKSDESDTTAPTRWHLDWANLFLTCKGGSLDTGKEGEFRKPISVNLSCDKTKKDYHNIFRPDEIPAFPRLFRYEQHENAFTIHPDEQLCKEAGFPVEKVQKTIDEFHLNCPRLCEARLAILKPLQRILAEYKPSDVTSLVQRYMRKNDSQTWSSFFTLFRWRFKEKAERYLTETGYNG